MWVRKILAVLLLTLFVFSIFGVADARALYRNRCSFIDPSPTGWDPEDDPWERFHNRLPGSTKIIGVIFINNIPVVVEVKDQVAVKKPMPFEAKRGK